MNDWMNEWWNERTDEWMNEWMIKSSECLNERMWNNLKGQSSEPIFWVECKNLLVIGPILGAPNIFDFGLIFAEIFVFENGLSGIVYYEESMLCILFTTQSGNSPSRLQCGVVKNISFFQQKHHWSFKICWGQNNKPILMKFSGKHAVYLFFSSLKYNLFIMRKLAKFN